MRSKTPPILATQGNKCPGRLRSVGFLELIKTSIVLASFIVFSIGAIFSNCFSIFEIFLKCSQITSSTFACSSIVV